MPTIRATAGRSARQWSGRGHLDRGQQEQPRRGCRDRYRSLPPRSRKPAAARSSTSTRPLSTRTSYEIAIGIAGLGGCSRTSAAMRARSPRHTRADTNAGRAGPPAKRPEFRQMRVSSSARNRNPRGSDRRGCRRLRFTAALGCGQLPAARRRRAKSAAPASGCPRRLP